MELQLLGCHIMFKQALISSHIQLTLRDLAIVDLTEGHGRFDHLLEISGGGSEAPFLSADIPKLPV